MDGDLTQKHPACDRSPMLILLPSKRGEGAVSHGMQGERLWKLREAATDSPLEVPEGANLPTP